MAIVITLATSKGGSGKTTLVAGLGTHWMKAGHKVGVVDADPNMNLSRWIQKDALKNMPLKSEPDESAIIDAIDTMAEDKDIVLVDIAGFGNQAMVYSIGVSDLVLIPSRPSEDDFLEAIKTKKLVDNASRLTRRDIPHAVVLTQAKVGTHVLAHTREQFLRQGISLCNTTIMNRTVFQTARYHGTTPVLSDPNGKAAKEIEMLAVELESMLAINPSLQLA